MSGRIPFHKKDTSYQQLEGNLSSLLECGSAFWQSPHLQSAASLNNFLRTGLPFPLHQKAEMKVPPISLPNGMDRIPLPLPFSPGMISLHVDYIPQPSCASYIYPAMSRIYIYPSDMLWRYPNPFLAQPPPSPLETQVKSGLPGEFLLKWLKDINSKNATVEEFFHSDHETLGIENQTTTRVK